MQISLFILCVLNKKPVRCLVKSSGFKLMEKLICISAGRKYCAFQFAQNKQNCLVSVFVVDLLTSQVVGPFHEALIHIRN